ncbi:MAG: glycosyltransferase family 2 protein [Patescibacteria group bacterium]|nr:glycosyltransferase family 2 protein [Patescibacteria group bacterium]
MNTTIVIPTYNEKDNIGPLLEELQKVFKNIKDFNMSILVVDDNSPDGTADIVRSKIKRYKNIHLITGEKQGLGAAYVRGFKYAMEKLKAEVVFEMDADFQHNPNDIPRFLEKISEGYDYVLGSRYVKGGSVPQNWGLHRKFFSFFGGWFARVVLGTKNVKDYTTGFKASRVKGYLDAINLSKILSKTFAYKIHLLYEMLCLKAKTIEIPINFVDREKEKSKSNVLREFKESMKVVLILRYRKNERFFKVCIVGAIGAFIQLVFASVLVTILGYNKAVLSNVLATEIAILANFFINNAWTFSDKKIVNLKILVKKLPMFNFLSLGSIAIQAIVMVAGTKFLNVESLFPYLSIVVVGILLGLIWNFTMYTKVVWRGK